MATKARAKRSHGNQGGPPPIRLSAVWTLEVGAISLSHPFTEGESHVVGVEGDAPWPAVRDRTLSRDHFHVECKNGQLDVVKIKNEEDGIFVNGKQNRHGPAGPLLVPGDVVRAGSTLFMVHHTTESAIDLMDAMQGDFVPSIDEARGSVPALAERLLLRAAREQTRPTEAHHRIDEVAMERLVLTLTDVRELPELIARAWLAHYPGYALSQAVEDLLRDLEEEEEVARLARPAAALPAPSAATARAQVAGEEDFQLLLDYYYTEWLGLSGRDRTTWPAGDELVEVRATASRILAKCGWWRSQRNLAEFMTRVGERWEPGTPQKARFVLKFLKYEDYDAFRADADRAAPAETQNAEAREVREATETAAQADTAAPAPTRRAEFTATRMRELRARFPNIVCSSASMLRVLEQAELLANRRMTVLVTGESGTGKELVARGLHDASDWGARPFVAVNCGAIPENLVESELFGHERGAFTGATAQKKGRFELASGGTLFLDEIGELRPETQVKLLRVLETSEFMRVGGTRTVRVDVRTVPATNRDLSEEVKAGGFREDLYYRVNVVQLRLPPLRERLEDLPVLVGHLLTDVLGSDGSPFTFSRGQLARLAQHDWPGNIRELKNVMEYAGIYARDGVLAEDHPFPFERNE